MSPRDRYYAIVEQYLFELRNEAARDSQVLSSGDWRNSGAEFYSIKENADRRTLLIEAMQALLDVYIAHDPAGDPRVAAGKLSPMMTAAIIAVIAVLNVLWSALIIFLAHGG